MTFISILAACMAAPDASALSAELRPYNGRQTIFLNGQPEAPLIYHMTGRSAHSPWIPEAQDNLKDFANAGYRLFGCQIPLGSVWTESGLDVNYVRRQLRAIREVRPDAAVLLRIYVEPPEWWLDRYPEERCAWTLHPGAEIPEAVRVKPSEWKRVSYASERWRADAGAQLRALLEGLAASPEGDCLFAVLVCAGQWWEWFYPGFEFEPDSGPAMTGHFRRWLAERYGSDEALRTAWQDDAVTLATAEVPGVDVRFRTYDRIFRVPEKERRAIDYYQCHQELVATVPLQFCHIVKATWPRPVLVGLFHAYFLHLSHQAPGGHLEMETVLRSPDVDFLTSPLSYETNARFLGGSGHYRCLTASIAAHGKLWMNENDHPTLVGDAFKRPGPFAPTNIPDSIATMRRNTAHCYTTGQGMWWFDFGGPESHGTGGWWKDPALMEEAGKELRLARDLMERPHTSVADVLFVYDPRCFYYLAQGHLGQYHQSKHWDRTDTLSFEALNDTVAEAYKSGAVFDLVHIDDLSLLDLTPYRVVVFGFTPYLTGARMDEIRRLVLTPGRTVVWVYAPGYTDGETLSTERVAEMVGMGIEKSTVNFNPELLLREGSLCPGFPETRIPIKIQDLAAWTKPTFQVVDPEAETVGYYVGSREVAMARKEVGGVHVWYCGLPLRHPSVMREIFRQGGAHIYNEKNDVLHAGGPVVWVHTETGGARTLVLRNGKRLDLTLEPWSTVVMDAESGKMLLE